jgi:hypothetical protein
MSVIISPYQLVMISYKCCFCNKPSSNGRNDDNDIMCAYTSQIEYNFGWVHCNVVDCLELLKNSWIKYLGDNNILTMNWYNKPICFYRKSKNIIDVSTNTHKKYHFEPNLEIYMKLNGKFYINLTFDKDLSRAVSLENVFFHNPELYDLILQCDNIDSNSMIKYSDLSSGFRDKIAEIYKLSQNLPADFVFDQ